MHLVKQIRLHFKEGTSDKVYEVDLCEIGGQYLVNFRFGRQGGNLKEGTKTPVPVSQNEAEKIFQKLVDEKTRKGYHAVKQENKFAEKTEEKRVLIIDPAARAATILNQLQAAGAEKNPRIERIIWRAGELQITEAAAVIAGFIKTGNALRDYCCAWSLGMCADENFLPATEKLLAHESEAVRRIAFEALLKLSKNPQQLIEQKKSELPESFRQILQAENSGNLLAAIRAEIANHKKGSFELLEHLYVTASENSRAVILQILREVPFKPKFFKTLRHIFKIAEYRRDAEVFGILAKRFEVENANFTYYWNYEWKQINGKWERIERGNGLTSEDSNFAFGLNTKKYFLRRSWRTLRRLGEISDAENYVKLAVGSLLAYTDADAQPPRTSTHYDYRDEDGNRDWRNPKIITVKYDEFAPYILFNQILHGNSSRYELRKNARAFSLKHDTGDRIPSFREESFPKLWEVQPVGLLHLLSESACRPVHEFAVKALKDCREFLAKLDLDAVLMLLQSSYDVTAGFGFELAEKFYDAANPNSELILAVAVCSYEAARKQAFEWINAQRDLYVENVEAMFRLLVSDFADTRNFAGNFLQAANFSEKNAQILIGRILSEMISFDENEREKAQDLGAILLRVFGAQLKSLSLAVVQDLLAHKLVEVREFAGKVLLIHETPTEKLPDELINSLIDSDFEQTRSIGIQLFGKLSDAELVRRDEIFFAFLSHDLEDIYVSIRPIIRRLAAESDYFKDVIVRHLIIALTRKEERENLHARYLTVLKEDLPEWTNFVDLDLAILLANSRFSNAAEAGGIVLQKRADEWFDEFPTKEIVRFSDNEVLKLREVSRILAEKNKTRFAAEKNPDFSAEINQLIKALDSKWEDSRKFWFEFFDKNLTEKELSPEKAVAICDSVREDVQQFGRETILKYFKTEDGAEYMLKLSEHPSQNMQWFVTNYLENYAAGSTENFAKLKPYFLRVLNLINRGRIAKTRILSFIENESLKSEETAKIGAEILARQSATAAIDDKARIIETMLKIHRKFPGVALPLKIKETAIRN